MDVKLELYGFPGEIYQDTLEWLRLSLEHKPKDVFDMIYVDSWGDGSAIIVISSEDIPMLIKVKLMKLIREQVPKAVIRFVVSQPFLNLRLDPVSRHKFQHI